MLQMIKIHIYDKTKSYTMQKVNELQMMSIYLDYIIITRYYQPVILRFKDLSHNVFSDVSYFYFRILP